jgi:hypothetical protein
MEDAALDAAKAEALEEPVEPVGEEAVEPVDDAVEEIDMAEEVDEIETDVEELVPQDHKERSNLGRKVSKYFEKSDTIEEILATQQKTLEAFGQKLFPEEPNYEDEEPVTKGDLKRIESAKVEKLAKYQNGFKRVVNKSMKKVPEADRAGIEELILEKYNVIQSEDGTADGADAFTSAYTDFYSKKAPLKQAKSPGGIKKQKVNKREKPLAKLKGASASYLNFVTREDGKEKAVKLQRSIS